MLDFLFALCSIKKEAAPKMKAFLFLYPIKPYFKVCIETHRRAFQENDYSPARISDIINSRYRQRGYAINWLMFGADKDPKEPDLSMVSDYIRIHKKDAILAAGVSFKA